MAVLVVVTDYVPMRLFLLLAAVLAGLLAQPVSAATSTVGTTSASPARDCAFLATYGSACTAVGAAIPKSGKLTAFKLNYADAPAGTKVSFKVLERTGDWTFRVRIATAETELPATAGTTEFPLTEPVSVSAGEYLGVYIGSAGVDFVADGGAGTYVRDGDAAQGEVLEYAGLTATPQLAATLDDGAAPAPTPDPDPGPDPDPDPGSTDGAGCTTARVATAPVAVSHTPATAAARGEWKLQVLDSAGSGRDYLEARAELDSKGHRHVAAKILNPDQVVYFGPAGNKVVDRTEFSGGLGLAVLRGATPLVAYRHHPGCDQLRMAVAPAFSPILFASWTQDIGGGFQFMDVAGERNANVVHAAYSYGLYDELVYKASTGARATLPMKNVRKVRVATANGRVAIAASDRNDTLRLFQLVRGKWVGKTVTTKLSRDWDMDLDPKGRPMIVYTAGSGRLFVLGVRGFRPNTGVDAADSVAIAADRRGVAHVAVTTHEPPDQGKSGGRECLPEAHLEARAGICAGKGFYYLRASRRKPRVEIVQRALGDHPPLSIAARGKRVHIVFAEPGRVVARVRP